VNERRGGATAGVFISYRRQETEYAAGWLYERLRERLGQRAVFKDIDSISPGDDFVDTIETALDQCAVVLVLIGTQWTTLADTSGRPRLKDEADLVRVEVETALRRDVRVVPVLVSGASMPTAAELPESLEPLTRRHAVELGAARFEADARRLLAAIQQAVDASTSPDERAAPSTSSGLPDRPRRPWTRRWSTYAALGVVTTVGAIQLTGL